MPDSDSAGVHPRRKRVTLADVAARAAVSLATVSQVLNGRTTCWASAKTRQRVLDAVAELGYRPNLSARALRSGETRTIGMITTGIGVGYARNRFTGVEEAAEKAGYTVMLSFHPNTPETEDQRIRNLLDRGVDGLIVYPSEPGPHVELRKLVKSGFPVVTLDGAVLLDFETDDVCADYDAVGRLQVRHLLDLGRKRLCLLTTAPIAKINAVRDRSVAEAVREAGLPPIPVLTVPMSGAVEAPDLTHAENLIHEFIQGQPQAVDGIISFDMLGALALRALIRLGRRIPEDTAVMASGDSIMAAYNTIPLSTITTRSDVQGEEAFSLLLSRLKDPSSALPFRRRLLPPELIPRRSTRPEPA